MLTAKEKATERPLFLLPFHYEAGVDVDAGLGVIPCTTATVSKSTGFGTSVAGELGIEEVVELAEQPHLRNTASLAQPLLHR